MKNEFFEMALFQHLYTLFQLDEAEAYLQQCKIRPLLVQDSPASTVSKYFRLMNQIDYTNLSFFDKRYINKTFFNGMNLQTLSVHKRAVKIFNKIAKGIIASAKGYLSYQYDGSANEATTECVCGLGDGLAPGNYITFGLYYTQFDENTKQDEFRNHNIIARLANRLQEKNIAIVSFSEVDLYKQLRVER